MFATLLLNFYKLVRLAGFEPTTPWFVAKYSIQLSYSRRALNSSIGFWLFILRIDKYFIDRAKRPRGLDA